MGFPVFFLYRYLAPGALPPPPPPFRGLISALSHSPGTGLRSTDVRLCFLTCATRYADFPTHLSLMSPSFAVWGKEAEPHLGEGGGAVQGEGRQCSLSACRRVPPHCGSQTPSVTGRRVIPAVQARTQARGALQHLA